MPSTSVAGPRLVLFFVGVTTRQVKNHGKSDFLMDAKGSVSAHPDNACQVPVQAFQQKLLAWFARYQRPLAWRRGYAPYHVWIAEIMGQQTQLDRVGVYLGRWLQRFDDVAAVAAASEQEILKAWEGLGYYSRARNIHRAAAIIMAKHQGRIPASEPELLALPGIGPYTAAAILSIAYNQPYPVVDANVKRVLSRLLDLDTPLDTATGKRCIQAAATRFFLPAAPRDYNQALMELGGLVCTPREPGCGLCPVQTECLAYHHATVAQRPCRKRARRKQVVIEMACCLIWNRQRLYIQQRLSDDVWGGLWEFPGGQLEPGESPAEAARREVLEETGLRLGRLALLATVVHHYSHYRVILHGFMARLASPDQQPVLRAASHCHWVQVDDLERYPFPAGHRQLVAKLR